MVDKFVAVGYIVVEGNQQGAVAVVADVGQPDALKLVAVVEQPVDVDAVAAAVGVGNIVDFEHAVDAAAAYVAAGIVDAAVDGIDYDIGQEGVVATADQVEEVAVVDHKDYILVVGLDIAEVRQAVHHYSFLN